VRADDLASAGRKPAQVSSSIWEQIDDLPVSQLKKFLSKKAVEADRSSFQADAMQTLSKSPSPVPMLRDSSRERLLQRHKCQSALEARAGVRKRHSGRNPCFQSTPYGFGRKHSVSDSASRLSKSRLLPLAVYNSLERKGLLWVEHRKAVDRLLEGNSDCKAPRLRDRVKETEEAVQREMKAKKGGRMLAGLDFLCAQAGDGLSAVMKSVLSVDQGY